MTGCLLLTGCFLITHPSACSYFACTRLSTKLLTKKLSNFFTDYALV